MNHSRIDLRVWALCCVLAGVVFIVYAALSIKIGGGQPVMPVDDAYIHFQYARQIAAGEFYVYNPGLPPTSGATSFLYPYVLALGHILGFHQLWLGLWAMGVGALALLVSGWTVYLLTRLFVASRAFSAALMTAFMLTGLISWHFMSGMETGLVMCFTLLTLYSFIARRRRLFILAATLLAIIRPEGGIMALIVVGLWWLHDGFTAQTTHETPEASLSDLDPHPSSLNTIISRLIALRHLMLLIPIIAIGIQPLVNLLVTGSASASGNQAKSLFGMIPPVPSEIWERIFENFGRFWFELFSGVSGGASSEFFLSPFIGLFALAGVLLIVYQRKRWDVLLLVCAWLLVISAAISTLDTAFWHFKRYQMPLLAMLFPLAGWCWQMFAKTFKNRPAMLDHGIGVRPRDVALAVALVLCFLAVFSGVAFLRPYAVNVESVVQQPLAMARWIAANTPTDAVIAVHDVGTIRYIGGRTTLDMVGLTTPGAADWWRNGPGAVGEFLIQNRPDLVAAYTDARGLNYLAETSVYGEYLEGFRHALDPRWNVALGGSFQGVLRPTWAGVTEAEMPQQGSILNALESLDGWQWVDQVNVANLDSEKLHNYRWSDRQHLPGFATEFYGLYLIDQSGCGVNCLVTDGGRRINGEEQFTLDTTPGQALILVTRVHPVNGGSFVVFADGLRVGARVIFSQPGNWLEIATLIPSGFITDTTTEIQIMPNTPDGHYMPYHHWAFQGDYPASDAFEPVITFDDSDVQLHVEPYVYSVEDESVQMTLNWYSEDGAAGDAKVFLHLYASLHEPPVAQFDIRPGNGTLPPANWLPGVLFTDTLHLDVAAVPAGEYTLALGLYDPVTEARFLPALNDGRFTIDLTGRRVILGTLDILTEREPADG